MVETLHNYISKILISDTNQSYAILTYIDFEDYSESDIIQYIETVYKNSDILKKTIIHKHDTFYTKPITLNIRDCYTIKTLQHTLFDAQTSAILNEPFEGKVQWKFYGYIDEETKQSRLYFKINHAYVDGYQVIKLLTSPYTSRDITTTFSRRCSNSLSRVYYAIVGTILMLFRHLEHIVRSLRSKSTPDSIHATSETDFITCRGFSLHDIKAFTKPRNLTVNDFVYSLMVKVDYLYSKQERSITSISPINVSSTKTTNNMAPLFFTIQNSYANEDLLKTVNEMFSAAKYSWFVPLFCYCVNFMSECLPIGVLSNMYNAITGNSDYVYSNMIGPSNDSVPHNVKDIHFVTTAKQREVIFNILSYDDTLNIICSFKKGVVVDTKLLEECIYAAYNDLLATGDGSSDAR